MTTSTPRATDRPAPTASARGRILWYENFASDSNKSVDFYGKLMGWGTETVSIGSRPYHMFTLNGKRVGGTLTAPPEARDMPSHWLMYVGVPDVDAAVKQARGLGAKVHVEPRDIPGLGRFAVMSDPQGAMFAFWKGERPVDPLEKAKVGQFSWHELGTTDPDKDWDFYQKLFGWEKREVHDMGAMGSYTEWSSPGAPFMLGGLFKRPKEMPVSAWVLYLKVADINKAAEQVKKLGGKIVNGPMEVPGGDMIAQGTDPNGAFFALHQTKK
jgi:predicted enzyme related to lactoylglutathione lyase